MELGGENLLTLINRLRAEGETFGPTLYLFTIKPLWQQMVSIVYTLQRNGIVHMDLKPDNLILFGSTLKIADLGISRKVNVAG
jgi:serine/threonine protein kinase